MLATSPECVFYEDGGRMILSDRNNVFLVYDIKPLISLYFCQFAVIKSRSIDKNSC